MDIYGYLTSSLLITWMIPSLFIIVFLIFITKTKLGISYRENTLGVHIRVLSLISLVLLLVYSSFFVDKTRLTSDADIKIVSLESDIAVLEKIIPSANEEYAMLISEIGELRAMTGGDYDKGKVYHYISQTESKIRSLSDKVDGARSRVLTQFGGGTFYSGSLKDELENPVISKINNLDGQLSRIRETKTLLEVIYSNNLRELKVVASKSEAIKIANHTDNIYYAMRALSLGGLGALITLLASYVLVEPNKALKINFIKSEHYWPLLLGHTLMGAVISIVAFGLFYTKQLTIFQPDTTSVGVAPPEYWRVTMLCVIAGAFAEKLYGAASNRVDKYMVDAEPNKQMQPTGKAAD